jgi:hypothetical protein
LIVDSRPAGGRPGTGERQRIETQLARETHMGQLYRALSDLLRDAYIHLIGECGGVGPT